MHTTRRMVATDRAFRALARLEPDLVLRVLRLALPELMPETQLDPTDVQDPKLDLPPPVEADLVATPAGHDVLHVEGQGYGETAFAERVFRYHLLLVLRHPGRRVRTVALWLTRPPADRRLGRIELERVTVEVDTVVLAELSADALLATPGTACFAAGADAGSLDDETLCARIASKLADEHAGWQRRLLCLAVAAARGRYRAMVNAMKEAALEIPIIEDLVRIGIDQGIEQGIERGIEQGLHKAIFEVLASRALPLSDEQRRRIEAETDEQRLLQWLRRATAASDSADVFET